MSPHARKLAYDRISHCFAVMYADLQQHQNVNDLSLNIHSENFSEMFLTRFMALNLKTLIFLNKTQIALI